MMKKHGEPEKRGKLFIGGLSWQTTQEGLLDYFRQFGQVNDAVVMKNPSTGLTRGFGFVTFRDPANVDAVLNGGPHQLDGRTIYPKPPFPWTRVPKVFLGGLPPNVTDTDLREFFGRYGKVVETTIVFDEQPGFGFVSFESDGPVERLIAEHFVNLNGKQVEIQRVGPRHERGAESAQKEGTFVTKAPVNRATFETTQPFKDETNL